MRCRFLMPCLVLLLASGALHAGHKKAKRPNILWIIAEDFGPHLGCYGTKQVWTPNLDKLAKEGVRYTHAFTTAPVCSASRSAFMTGMYQTTIGAHNHRSHRKDGYQLPDGVRVLTDWLRDINYFTLNIRNFPIRGLRGTGKEDWNFTYKGKAFDSDNWKDVKKNEPFYAQINFSETHRAFTAPKKADPSKVVIPPYLPDHPVIRRDWAAYLDEATELDRKIGMVIELLRKEGLLENTIIIFFGDNGQAHLRGKQWCYDSGLSVPLIIRWPANFPVPDHFRPGTVSDQLIEAVDLSATTLSLAGMAKPKKMQGRVFLGPKAEPPGKYAFGARDRCDATVFRLRTVRTAKYRYIKNFTHQQPFTLINRYIKYSYPAYNLMHKLHAEGKLTKPQQFLMAPTMPPEELYDLENDPYEIHNLAGSNNPKHQKTLKHLRSVLDDWIVETNDQGRIPESKEILDYWKKRMNAIYDKREEQKKKKKRKGSTNKQTSPVSFLGGFDKLREVDRKAFSARFEKAIWPLMRRNGKDGCVGCHNLKHRSTLRLKNDADKDFRKMLKDGFFLPDDPGSILHVVSTNTKQRMPPGDRPRWTAKEIELLRCFVADLDKKQQR